MTEVATRQHRQLQLALRARTLRDLLTLWPALDLADLATFPAWRQAVGAVITRDRAVSVGLSTAYLQQVWRLEGIAPGPLVTPAPPAAEQVTSSLAVTSVRSYERALSTGRTPSAARAVALVTSSGAAARLVLDGGRETVAESVRADSRALGYRRVTDGRPCHFCALLASRGAVYGKDTARFESHDACGCGAEPVYRQEQAGPRPEAQRWADLYEQEAAGRTDQLNAFRRAYAAL